MPDIDYSSKDYLGFRQFLLARKQELLPEWTSEAPSDFGVVLIELFAYVGDILSFYGDRVATEAYLSTATQRRSLLALAEMLDYQVTNNVPATVDVTFHVTADVTIPAGTQVQTSNRAAIEAGEEAVVFEVAEDTLVTAPSGAVPCVEGQTISDEQIGSSDGSIDQTYTLFRYPVIEGSVQVFVDEGAGPVEWTEFGHLIDAANVSEAFEVTFDEVGAATIQFGDNVNGRVPSSGADIMVTYRVGGGERGNVGPGTIVELVHSIPEVQSPSSTASPVTNVSAASGGSDAESNDQIRVNAPRSLSALNRAVTLKDYADLAVQVAEIAKAKAINVGTDITVHVAPFGGGTAGAGLKTRVAEYLDQRKMINHTVTIGDPAYVPIMVTVDVVVLPNYSRGVVALAVENAVNQMFAFSRVDFAYRVSLSKIYDVVQSVAGVDYAQVTELSTDGLGGIDDLVLDDIEIPTVGTTTINATGGIAGT